MSWSRPSLYAVSLTTIDDPEMVDVLKPIGLEVETSTPEELLALIELHNKTWQARLSSTGLAAAN